jgi:hypothetical protein
MIIKFSFNAQSTVCISINIPLQKYKDLLPQVTFRFINTAIKNKI